MGARSNRTEIGEAIVELDEDMVVQTLRDRHTRVVLRFIRKDKEITQRRVTKAAQGTYGLTATMTKTRIELYTPGLNSLDDVRELVATFAKDLDKLLPQHSPRPSKPIRSGYRNDSPTRR